MNTNNETTCPRCAEKEIEKAESFSVMVSRKYGKVSEDEYKKLLKQDVGPYFIGSGTLNEICNASIDVKGTLVIYYSCSCSVCGLNFNFEHTASIIGKSK